MEKKSKPKKKAKLPSLDVNQRYDIPEALAYLRTSRASIYKLIKAGSLHVKKEGKRTFVPGAEIARYSALTS